MTQINVKRILQRVVDGLEKKYVDENQALILIDHMMRIRCFEEVIADLKKRIEPDGNGEGREQA